jgi:hypothetical protein
MSDRAKLDTIISFRLDKTMADKLSRKFDGWPPIMDIRSTNHFSRKILLDFLNGRLVYLNPKDAKQNPNM